jgi:EAL domain-containing protein (putative c-di-GMP-specific phosphodiesterase class I)
MPADPEFSVGCGGRCADQTQFDLRMAFQPIVDVETSRIYGYEALVRGPQGESAGSVLAGVNRDNLYAFDQACRVKAIETAARLGLDRRLSINFLPNAVYHPEACLRLTFDAAEKYGFPLDQITFELTEDEQIADRQHLKNIIETYRRHGFQTALDDFGTGYAGLSLLADFQPDVIKIDRFLVADIDRSRARQAIVPAILSAARALDLRVVVEGVERKEEVERLRDMGVRYFQGFFFGRPTLERIARDDEIPWF